MDKEIIEMIKRLKSYVLSIISDDDTANEIVQNCLIKAFTRGKLVQNHTGWLFTVAKHETYKLLKEWQLPIHDYFPKAPKEYHENSIIDYMHLLDAQERNLLFMRYFNQFSIKELSKLLNKPEGTMKRKLFEARESLKKEMIMSEKMTPPEIEIITCEDQTAKSIKINGQGLLMGNPGLPIGDCELIHYYEYPGRVFAYQSETEVVRTMEIAGKEVVEIINHYKKRSGEIQRRMYYEVLEDRLEMVMRIFEWGEEGIKVETDKKELVRPECRTLKTGEFPDEDFKIVDIVNLKIDDNYFPNTFRVRSACNDYHGKEYIESFYSEEGREVLHRSYIGNNWKMGGFVTWEKLQNSMEIEFHEEKYRLWSEIVLLKRFKKDLSD